MTNQDKKDLTCSDSVNRDGCASLESNRCFWLEAEQKCEYFDDPNYERPCTSLNDSAYNALVCAGTQDVMCKYNSETFHCEVVNTSPSDC